MANVTTKAEALALYDKILAIPRFQLQSLCDFELRPHQKTCFRNYIKERSLDMLCTLYEVPAGFYISWFICKQTYDFFIPKPKGQSK